MSEVDIRPLILEWQKKADKLDGWARLPLMPPRSQRRLKARAYQVRHDAYVLARHVGLADIMYTEAGAGTSYGGAG